MEQSVKFSKLDRMQALVELANRLSRSCMETVSPKTWLSITEEAARRLMYDFL